MLRTCSDCGATFDPRAKRHGLIDQCERCGRREEADRDVQRYLGRRGGETKTDACVIYRENLLTIKAWLRAENRAGRNANLGLGNPSRREIERPDED